MPPQALLPELHHYLSRQRASRAHELHRLYDLPAAFQEVADAVTDVSGSWNAVEIYTPSRESLVAEKERFLAAHAAGRDYAPRFRYAVAEGMRMGAARRTLTALREAARTLPVRGNTLAKTVRTLLIAKIDDDLATCDLVDGIRLRDERRIKDALNAKYWPLSRELLLADRRAFDAAIAPRRQAKAALSAEEIVYLDNRMFSPREAKYAFEKVLAAYGLLRRYEKDAGFRVVVSDHVTAIDVRHRSAGGPTIFLPPVRMSAYETLYLLRHEVEGHARQSANGETLFGFGGGALTMDDETMYEGLAMRLETEFKSTWFGRVTDTSPRFYAHAVHLAERGCSFAEIFRDLLDRHLHVLCRLPLAEALPAIDDAMRAEAEGIAWRTTYRVMRGHTDMTNAAGYAMRKDLAYKRGLLLDATLCAHGRGFINECAILAQGGLPLIGALHISERDLPYKDKNVTVRYMKELLQDLYTHKDARRRMLEPALPFAQELKPARKNVRGLERHIHAVREFQ